MGAAPERMGAAPERSGRAALAGGEGAEEPPSLLARLFGCASRRKTASHQQGAGDAGVDAAALEEERDLLANVKRMRDQRVEDVMIPRADIVSAPASATLEELVAVFRDASLTRVPVFRETLDDPIGFIHLKDLAFAYGFDGAEARAKFDIHRHMRPLLYVPPSMPTAKLLQRMQASRKHIALIIDEYGGVDGLVTIEDLVEQIVGEIDDEHDGADPAPWREESKGVFVALARADVAAFEEAAGVDLLPPDLDEDVDTLGGLVFMLSNRVPERGEVIETPDGHEFEVIEADPRRIKRLRVTLAGSGPDRGVKRPARPAGGDAPPAQGGADAAPTPDRKDGATSEAA
ncbi:magnesium and cobalt transporter [Rubrimonas cliftonensis]|uniref:Magnesium and cobalt transporter n=1 Tax=Rubrimonas cliftonensis TaxID=89524 RepID=A0A1H4DXD9_9RHOB|nr:magnesium and cobalt transporter [Rubrimonas cliftonensis]